MGIFAWANAVELPELNWTPGSDWRNVKELGVKGDGTTDDTAALQQILTELKDGEILYFPPGTYLISGELLIWKKNRENLKERRLLGNAFYGHGASTVIKYQGAPGRSMLRITGMLHYRMIGFVFDGGGLADIGMFHDNFDQKILFETHLFHQFIAMRNFKKYGLYFGYFEKKTGVASAETAFVNMIFSNCGTGAAFTNFNDYNYTFDGCYFQNNERMGLECVNGNFYVRNSRFEKNKLDIYANPEHSSSIRRCVSVNSGRFLETVNVVSPMTVEGCFVTDWSGESAILSSGAPVTIFDNTFKSSAGDLTVLNARKGQALISGNNRLLGKVNFSRNALDNLREIPLPPGELQLSEQTVFMPEKVKLPGKHFDAKIDFGAKGDGQTDDTNALQQAIDAARTHGKNAIAYLPRGTYRTTRPLNVSGSGYYVGGSGLYSVVSFAGSPDESAIEVHPEGELTLDAFRVERNGLKIEQRKSENRVGNRTSKYADFSGKGTDICQYPSKNGSRVTYHTVYVTGKYVEIPFHLGFRLENLAKHDTVQFDNIEGNVHSINSGAATILHRLGYEGTVWVKGDARGGFFGIMTRLATLSRYSIYVEDNQSLTVSDFYIEQAVPETLTFKGSPDKEPGRLTISCVKIDQVVDIDHYRGAVNFIGTQWYGPKAELEIAIKGQYTDINILGSVFYIKGLKIDLKNGPVNYLSNSEKSSFNHADITSFDKKEDPKAASAALLDFRKLGQIDWQLNYPQLLK